MSGTHKDGYYFPDNWDLFETPELGVKCPTCSAPPGAACRQQDNHNRFYTIRAHRTRVAKERKS